MKLELFTSRKNYDLGEITAFSLGYLDWRQNLLWCLEYLPFFVTHFTTDPVSFMRFEGYMKLIMIKIVEEEGSFGGERLNETDVTSVLTSDSSVNHFIICVGFGH